MDKAVIFDLDGTICDCTHRLHLIQGKNKDWEKFHDESINDEQIESMIDLLDTIIVDGCNKVVFCTTRPDTTKDVAIEWISRNTAMFGDEVNILMRKSGDHRPDHVIKLENLEKAGLTPDKVSFIVEDRASVVKALRERGYKVLQCDEGNY